MRGHLALLEENRGETPWCGPAALALATGRSYAEAAQMLRNVAPAWYPAEGPIVTAYWRDLLVALDMAGVAHAPALLPERRRSLSRFARDGLAEGWHLVRDDEAKNSSFFYHRRRQHEVRIMRNPPDKTAALPDG